MEVPHSLRAQSGCPRNRGRCRLRSGGWGLAAPAGTPRPGANARGVADEVYKALDRLSNNLPQGTEFEYL